MIVHDKESDQLQIVIPIEDVEEVDMYKKGILGLLRKIEVENCNPELKRNIKIVYELLSHLTPDGDFNLCHDKMFNET